MQQHVDPTGARLYDEVCDSDSMPAIVLTSVSATVLFTTKGCKAPTMMH